MGLQDGVAQHLMDELDLPAERARLFDVLDADGNGSLDPTELIQGLLRVRGEAQRSDVLAGVLGIRVVLHKMHDIKNMLEELCQVWNLNRTTTALDVDDGVILPQSTPESILSDYAVDVETITANAPAMPNTTVERFIVRENSCHPSL